MNRTYETHKKNKKNKKKTKHFIFFPLEDFILKKKILETHTPKNQHQKKMSKYLLFLRESNDNMFLKLVREQSAPLRSDQEEVKDDEAEEDDETMIAKLPKQALRRNSEAVVNLIHRLEPSLSDCKSDTSCLQQYTKDN